MKDIQFPTQDIQAEALHDTLKAALGQVFVGISQSSAGIRVHVQSEVTREQEQQLQALFAAHNPNELTPRQAARQARQATLASLQAKLQQPLDVQAYANESPLIQALAERIARLELEREG